MLGRIPVRPGVVHVNMNISADPARAFLLWQFDFLKLNLDIGRLTTYNLNPFLLEFVLETLHYPDCHCPNGNLDRRVAVALEVMGFEPALAAIKAVVRLHPCIARRVSPAICRCEEDARRCHLSIFIGYPE